jgi:hypothetical protein
MPVAGGNIVWNLSKETEGERQEVHFTRNIPDPSQLAIA